MRQFIYPYLLLDNAMDAANYYKEMLNGEIYYVMYGKDTPNCPEDRLETVVHLQLRIKQNQIYMADNPGSPNEVIQLLLDYEDKDEMIGVFNRFKEESEIIQDLGKTYWGAYFGVLKDKFGVVWQFHHMLEEE